MIQEAIRDFRELLNEANVNYILKKFLFNPATRNYEAEIIFLHLGKNLSVTGQDVSVKGVADFIIKATNLIKNN